MPRSSRNLFRPGSKKNLDKGDRKVRDEAKTFSSVAPPTEGESGALAARMPALAGKPLPAPSFHKADWQANQVFTWDDDPDRTRLPWAAPDFVHRKDPGERRLDIEELPVTTSRRGGACSSFARIARHVLDEEDCAALISAVNAKGFTPALLNIGGGRQQLVPGARNGHRVIVDSPNLTNWLLEVLLPCLPAVLEDGSRLVELNERCRFLCYTPGQQFPVHCDGTFERPEGHPRSGDYSFVTVQLYLHDIPTSYGGATAFALPGRPRHQPEAGSVLLFTQDLMHEGCLVAEGVKYTLRTEAMYAPPTSSVDVAT
jgi:predicted 2-oxoglutarate/Fe(II)-dependent dioxygenase YbiX